MKNEADNIVLGIKNHIMFKLLVLILGIIQFISCSNDNKINSEKKLSSEIKNDTVIIRENHLVENNNSYSIQTKKEIEYFVSLKNENSNIKYVFIQRNDGKVVIRRNFDFLNLPTKVNNFNFEELKYILKDAKNDFKIDSLYYIIYGTLSSSNKVSEVENITKKVLEGQNGKTNIETINYKKISDLILESAIVKDFNSSLIPYSKYVSKINIEKAFIRKQAENSKKLLDCMIVMTIEDLK